MMWGVKGRRTTTRKMTGCIVVSDRGQFKVQCTVFKVCGLIRLTGCICKVIRRCGVRNQRQCWTGCGQVRMDFVTVPSLMHPRVSFHRELLFLWCIHHCLYTMILPPLYYRDGISCVLARPSSWSSVQRVSFCLIRTLNIYALRSP